MSLQITEKRDGKIRIVYLAGMVDSSSADVLTASLTKGAPGGGVGSGGSGSGGSSVGGDGAEIEKVIVDIAQLIYITSAGFRSLLIAHREFSACDCEFALSGVRGDFVTLFNMSGFGRIFRIFDRIEDAIAA